MEDKEPKETPPSLDEALKIADEEEEPKEEEEKNSSGDEQEEEDAYISSPEAIELSKTAEARAYQLTLRECEELARMQTLLNTQWEAKMMEEEKERKSDDIVKEIRKPDLQILIRFLLALKVNPERGLNRYFNFRKMLHKHNIGDSRDITLEGLEEELDTEKIIVAEDPSRWTIDNFPILYYTPRNHCAGQFPIADTLKMCLFAMERCASTVEGARKGLVWVMDMEELGWSNIDFAGEELFLELMQDTYPARIGKGYILNAPWWIRAMMAIFRPFMKQKLRDRMVQVTLEELTEQIKGGLDSIPLEVGGRWDWSAKEWKEAKKLSQVTPEEMLARGNLE